MSTDESTIETGARMFLASLWRESGQNVESGSVTPTMVELFDDRYATMNPPHVGYRPVVTEPEHEQAEDETTTEGFYEGTDERPRWESVPARACPQIKHAWRQRTAFARWQARRGYRL